MFFELHILDRNIFSSKSINKMNQTPWKYLFKNVPSNKSRRLDQGQVGDKIPTKIIVGVGLMFFRNKAHNNTLFSNKHVKMEIGSVFCP